MRTDTLDALQAYKARMGLTDWDATLGALLEGAA